MIDVDAAEQVMASDPFADLMRRAVPVYIEALAAPDPRHLRRQTIGMPKTPLPKHYGERRPRT